MSYKIAIASNDGVFIDEHFANSSSFIIIDVNHNGSYSKIEERLVRGHSDRDERVSLIADCRCLLCKEIDSQAKWQLDQREVTTFQMDCKIDEALEKIIVFYLKIDNRISFKRAITSN